MTSLAALAACQRGGCGGEAEEAPAGEEAAGAPAGEDAGPSPRGEGGDDERAYQVVLALNGHVTVVTSSPDFTDHAEVARRARAFDPVVVGAQPLVVLQMKMAGERGAPVFLMGLDPGGGAVELDRYASADALQSLAAGPAAGEPPPVLLGATLARAGSLEVGDLVSLHPLPGQEEGSARAPGTLHRLRVAGTLETGFAAYDEELALVSLSTAQALLGRGDSATGVELRLDRPERARDVARRLGEALGPPYQVLDWCELNRELLAARCGALPGE
ncbi:MAG TPA: hypothetical protein VKZ63_22540 [Kofleriaceae bacterium]|nr:hypothetical protein [Kofleriaceae bacterium]